MPKFALALVLPLKLHANDGFIPTSAAVVGKKTTTDRLSLPPLIKLPRVKTGLPRVAFRLPRRSATIKAAAVERRCHCLTAQPPLLSNQSFVIWGNALCRIYKCDNRPSAVYDTNAAIDMIKAHQP